MSTIFTKIIEREIPGQFVYEDDMCVAVMDKFPSLDGQVLVILKREVDYVFDMTDEEYQHLFLVAKKIARAIDKSLETARTCLVVEGFEVPHVHIKLYPFRELPEGGSLGERLKTTSEKSDEELQKVAEKIKTAL